jgi:transglutaminase-like putative cysteine protease
MKLKQTVAMKIECHLEKSLVLMLLFQLLSCPTNAQYSNGFGVGRITYAELELKRLGTDTSAYAVVLDEFGEAYIDNGGENNLLLEYHVKIKILTKQGLDQANFLVQLRKGERGKESIRAIEAYTYNLVNNSIKQTQMDKSQIFITNANQYLDECKFTLPAVQVGSVIEVKYILESPFIFNFWPWKFQREIPKLRSEFWARIPGNYVYNVSLRGFLPLKTNESSILKDCFTPGGNKAECSWYKFTMESIPAFVEEDYMTAKSNFIAGIDYELSEIRHFDGRVVKYTKSWKDVDKEMNTHEDFGIQIKKGKNVWQNQVAEIVKAHADPLRQAASIYSLVQDWFTWNDSYGKYTELGLKKAFESKKGNVGDINLSLVAALQEAGLDADPVILATREAGLPNQLYPVISDFNYVVAQVLIGDEKYLLDASDPLLPFGLLPERCLNGEGRLISKKVEEGSWIALKPREKQKKQILLSLKLDNNKFTGEMSITSQGYEAYDKRGKIYKAGSLEKYKEKEIASSQHFEISNYEIENLEDISKPLVEKFQVVSSLDVSNPNLLYLNPFFVERWNDNPFKSNERLYPVDFGAPLNSVFILNLQYPDSYVIDEMPKSVAMALPQNGGRYTLNITNLSTKISMTSIINLSKVVYTSEEYHSLKELFNRIIQTQQSQIVFKKK